MCESYARSLLRVSVAQICQALGWDAVQLSACELLSDVLHRYLQQLARGCHRYSELYGRTDPMLDDVGQAFRLLGVNLNELEDYILHLEPVPFARQTPLFPVSKNNVLQFPQPEAWDAEERKDYIPDYMPPLVSLQEEEEEQVLADMGTSAEAMQVALDEAEANMEEEEAVNDENYLGKRHLDSPDSLDLMPAMKRSRLPGFKSTDSPEWGIEPREPLSSLNPQRVPQTALPYTHSHDSSSSLSFSLEPAGLSPASKTQPPAMRLAEFTSSSTPHRKPKVNSPGKPKLKCPKGASPAPGSGGPICSPKALQKERKKSPVRTKSPKSPKSPKTGSTKVFSPPVKVETQLRPPTTMLSEKMAKENPLQHQSPTPAPEPDKPLPETPHETLEPHDNTIDDSIDAVIERARAENGPDPFAFASGSESESDTFSSPRRLTISEPTTPKLLVNTNNFSKDALVPVPPSTGVVAGIPNSWTMDDSINEVLRKVNQGGSSGTPPNPTYLSSPSASPPTPQPLLKVYEERNKLAASTDIRKKLKKELKAKIKKKEKDKIKEKDKDRDKGKSKEKNREKNRHKDKEFGKESKLPWKDLPIKEDEQRDLFKPHEFNELVPAKVKPKESGGSRKEKDKHKDKKKDKEKSRKDKEKRDKSKDKAKEDRQKSSAASLLLDLKEAPLFSPAACLRLPPMLPIAIPDMQFLDKDKVKWNRYRRIQMNQFSPSWNSEVLWYTIKSRAVKVEPPAAAQSPVIPRLTLRVGAGQDKIVISKVVPTQEVKTPAPKTPAAKAVPAIRPRTPPSVPILVPVPPVPAPTPLHPLPVAPPAATPAPLPPPSPTLPATVFSKTPVRSVVTETVSTYVIRDEWGNQIWICPGCNKPDDGSPMIGCDDCDDWYHWPCVGLLAAPPEDVQWFCVKCESKSKKKDKDKKHKKRKHRAH
ncbi:transcription initiation factor TFIID subunit 3-like [Scleropages formosus]|uniref:transcription initiation factor TFIID subunit 3-like n=1 Tax=Scleropages formosus TaxID=113540 RepID=UPI0010FA9430|nr:transcription initiation factor TFIID subunit 3-like [Scleropages formosus]